MEDKMKHTNMIQALGLEFVSSNKCSATTVNKVTFICPNNLKVCNFYWNVSTTWNASIFTRSDSAKFNTYNFRLFPCYPNTNV